MKKINPNELNDGDLIIDENGDIEIRHKVDDTYCFSAWCRLPYSADLKPMEYIIEYDNCNYKCFIIKKSDKDYDYWKNMPNSTRYGYPNKL